MINYILNGFNDEMEKIAFGGKVGAKVGEFFKHIGGKIAAGGKKVAEKLSPSRIARAVGRPVGEAVGEARGRVVSRWAEHVQESIKKLADQMGVSVEELTKRIGKSVEGFGEHAGKAGEEAIGRIGGKLREQLPSPWKVAGYGAAAAGAPVTAASLGYFGSKRLLNPREKKENKKK